MPEQSPPDGGATSQGGAFQAAWSFRWTLLLFILPLLLSYLPGLRGFPYSTEQSLYSDIVTSHLPNLLFLRRSLAAWGSVPLWSPLVLSGAPFAANPLAGLWYPPGWLALVVPIPFGFNLLVMAHLFWGASGVYTLLRQEGLGQAGSALAGVGFAALPKLAAHYGAGHLTLLYAVPWTPWLLWASCYRKPRPRAGLSGVILALIFLADARWAVYAGILGVIWVFSHSHTCFKGLEGETDTRKSSISLRRVLSAIGVELTLAFLLAAPLALPLLEFSRRTTRASLAAADILAFSLPPARLLGLFFPDHGGNPEWVLYPGVLILALGSLALAWPATRAAARFWAWLLFICLVFSLGDALPGMALIADLPGFSLLRVPPRALFLAGLSLLVLAAYAVDHIQNGVRETDKHRATLILVALAAFVIVLAAGIQILTHAWLTNFLWGAGGIVVAVVWILAGLNYRIAHRFWFAGLLVFCLVDWAGVDAALIAPRSPQQVFSEGAEAADFLVAQEGLFRTYSPSYSLPQQTSAMAGLELADGVDPLQLRSYADFMVLATGIPSEGYSVTLPPFASGNPEEANESFTPDPELLGWLNVRYVLSSFDLAVEGLELVRQTGSTRIYFNRLVRPRAWIQAEGDKVGELIQPAEIFSYQANEISLQAEGPGTLVLSEIAYPGWDVYVDGELDEPLVVSGLFRGVSLPAGDHEVIFHFKPVSVTLGLGLGGMGLLFLAGRFLWGRPWQMGRQGARN